MIKVYSGDYCLCDIGIPIYAEDVNGKPLHTGDIVMIYSGMYIGTDLESWHMNSPLTVVVCDQYNYSNDNTTFYVMGIKTCGFNHLEWQIHIVKKYYDVIAGEHWPEWGFNYHE